MISIVIPLYNKVGPVGRTLRSVAAGELQDCEVVVVDDGSTDGSAEAVLRAVEELGIEKFRLIPQQNGGVGAARNRGIAEAKGEFVAFIDADDEWRPDHIQTLKQLARDYPQCAVFATAYDDVMADGKVVPAVVKGLPFAGDSGVIDNYFEIASESKPPLWTSAVMVRRDALKAIGGFPEGIKSGEDLLTWARLACRHGIAYSTRPTALYNRGYSNPRPPEKTDEVGRQLNLLHQQCPHTKGLKRYIARWHNMRMSRCLAHRMYAPALRALALSLRYRPTPRILKPLLQFTLVGLRRR